MKLFNTELVRQCLREAIGKTQTRHPYETVAFCLLPDHLHCVWKLPEGDANFSIRWSSIKGWFSREYQRLVGHQGKVPCSRKRKEEACIWQRRFWEHQIRNHEDLQRHVDYIHYNPVRHGWVQRVEDWPWSTYHRYVREGFYRTAGYFDETANTNLTDFGE